MTNTARRLKKLRSKAGLNQSQLARSVNVTRAAASRWEQGDIDSILARNAIRVADTLNTSVEYLFTGKQPCTQIDVDALSRAIRIV
ncbi:MAG TPA: XRE family transcriptional regulator, partial [Gammaproteobacteria bacterium]|nr:XRE family transcriptional regulator [Gammaproteobacteria bacterium]